MNRSGDEFDLLRRRLIALREDPDAADAASAAMKADLARIRAELHRLAQVHAQSWRDFARFARPS
jgi:hypothetical protein